MSTDQSRAFRIVGIHGSPYSRKLLAAFRYRRIPHRWIVRESPEDHSLPQPRVALLPRLIREDANGELSVTTDTTPILRELDREFSDRSLRPPDPVIALLDAILEDWADEWLTKAMFHYRWAFADDIARASEMLPRWARPDRPDDEVRRGGTMFAERQISRLGVVGSNASTAPVIEVSYRRTLTLLSDHLASQRFLLGGRPSAADFAVYGQLTQLAGFDPTPKAMAYALAPRVVAWVHVVEDLSGLEPVDSHWLARGDVTPTLRALLAEVGRVYVPFLLANAAAVASGADQVDCEIDGRRWTQKPFPYQAKCLRWLREEHAGLAAVDRRDADAMLEGSGCEALFAAMA
jgi:glutathione S-transferase